MNTIITFTLTQLVGLVLAICAAMCNSLKAHFNAKNLKQFGFLFYFLSFLFKFLTVCFTNVHLSLKDA